MSHRMLQVNENMQRELSRLLAEEPVVEDALVTLTRVFVTADLRQATAWVSILNNSKSEKEIIDLLNKRSSEFYVPLRDRLKMKHIPQITFKFDDQADELGRIDELLDDISEQS